MAATPLPRPVGQSTSKALGILARGTLDVLAIDLSIVYRCTLFDRRAAVRVDLRYLRLVNRVLQAELPGVVAESALVAAWGYWSQVAWLCLGRR